MFTYLIFIVFFSNTNTHVLYLKDGNFIETSSVTLGQDGVDFVDSEKKWERFPLKNISLFVKNTPPKEHKKNDLFVYLKDGSIVRGSINFSDEHRIHWDLPPGDVFFENNWLVEDVVAIKRCGNSPVDSHAQQDVLVMKNGDRQQGVFLGSKTEDEKHHVFFETDSGQDIKVSLSVIEEILFVTRPMSPRAHTFTLESGDQICSSDFYVNPSGLFVITSSMALKKSIKIPFLDVSCYKKQPPDFSFLKLSLMGIKKPRWREWSDPNKVVYKNFQSGSELWKLQAPNTLVGETKGKAILKASLSLLDDCYEYGDLVVLIKNNENTVFSFNINNKTPHIDLSVSLNSGSYEIVLDDSLGGPIQDMVHFRSPRLCYIEKNKKD